MGLIWRANSTTLREVLFVRSPSFHCKYVEENETVRPSLTSQKGGGSGDRGFFFVQIVCAGTPLSVGRTALRRFTGPRCGLHPFLRPLPSSCSSTRLPLSACHRLACYRRLPGLSGRAYSSDAAAEGTRGKRVGQKPHRPHGAIGCESAVREIQGGMDGGGRPAHCKLS